MNTNNFLKKANELPESVKKVLFSNETTETVFGINTSYGLNWEQSKKSAQIIGQVFIKKIPINQYFEVLQKNIDLPQDILAGVAVSVAKKIFLPLKDYFGDLKPLINQWQTNASSPKYKRQSLGLFKVPTKEQETMIKPTQAKHHLIKTDIIKKDIKNIAKEFPEIGSQLIGTQPIRVANSGEPVSPSIKNWLKDYIRQKETNNHSIIKRSNYLYYNPNTQILNKKEREKLSQLLKSYDENMPLSISLKNKEILFEETQIGPKIEGNLVNLKNYE